VEGEAMPAVMLGTILVVDDEPYVLQVLDAVLRREGFRVVAADSAERAAEILAWTGARLVVTDLELPGHSGLEFAEAMAGEPRLASIPLIVLTARAGGLEGQRPPNVVAIIGKPFSPKALVRSVHDALGGERVARPRIGVRTA
jgi:CheY-like chemotaxis protein